MIPFMDPRYIFIAGGIGITPFRSIIQQLVLTRKKATITLFYIAKTEDEFIFKEELESAKEQLDLTIVYHLSNSGSFSPRMITKQVKEYRKCMYYLSGPQEMVLNYQTILLEMGIEEKQLAIDSFSGYNLT